MTSAFRYPCAAFPFLALPFLRWTLPVQISAGPMLCHPTPMHRRPFRSIALSNLCRALLSFAQAYLSVALPYRRCAAAFQSLALTLLSTAIPTRCRATLCHSFAFRDIANPLHSLAQARRSVAPALLSLALPSLSLHHLSYPWQCQSFPILCSSTP